MCDQPLRAQAVRLLPGAPASGPCRPCAVIDRCTPEAGSAAIAAAMCPGHGPTCVVTIRSAPAASSAASASQRTTRERLFQLA